MVAQESGGAIVNFGDWAITRPYLNYAAYFASKGSIPTLTRTFAVELASRNPRVRVNAILPGPVMLPPDLPEEERARGDRRHLGQTGRHSGPCRRRGPVSLAQRFHYWSLPARRRWAKHLRAIDDSLVDERPKPLPVTPQSKFSPAPSACPLHSTAISSDRSIPDTRASAEYGLAACC